MKRQMASQSSPIAALAQLLQTDTGTGLTPCLPQQASEKQSAKRRYQLQMARTKYNYMLTYIDSVPFSARVPKNEKFSADYRALVEKVIAKMAENFRDVVLALYKVQFNGDLPLDLLDQLRRNPEKVVRQWAAVLAAMQQDGSDDPSEPLPPGVAAGQCTLLQALQQVAHLPGDLDKLASGLQQVAGELAQDGPTAILKSLLRQTVATGKDRNFLRAESLADFEALYPSLPLPLALAIEPKDWMQGDDLPCLQDWFFGYLQSAGFNTTLLRGVVEQEQPGCLTLAQLQQKMPIDDAIFQRVLGDGAPSLQRAVEWKRLYTVDFHCLQGAKNSVLNGQERFMSAPIVLLYWNPVPPPGYPPGQGVLQPVAIQLAQQHDPESAPIFTPNDSADANDANHLKWKLAKYIVNAMQAIPHESVAHLGEWHLAIEPIILATRRQLAHNHPLMSFGPCVMGAVYHKAPTKSTVLASEQDCLPWYSPLDVTLYTFSFEYLLSNVQYDRFGHYGGTPSVPYFADPRVAEILADFQQRLAEAEAEIRRRNRNRAVPYPFQLPSRIPNSISI